MAISIYLNIYDLTSINNFLDCIGIGAYHSAIQIFDTEFSFGAHPYNYTGVIENNPHSNKLIRFRKTIFIGNTNLKLNEINKVLTEMKSKYIGNTYDVFKNNCNHFANDISLKLLSKPIPKYINRLSNYFSLFRCFFSSKLIYGDALQSFATLKKVSINKQVFMDSQNMLEKESQANFSKTDQKSENNGETYYNENFAIEEIKKKNCQST